MLLILNKKNNRNPPNLYKFLTILYSFSFPFYAYEPLFIFNRSLLALTTFVIVFLSIFDGKIFKTNNKFLSRNYLVLLFFMILLFTVDLANSYNFNFFKNYLPFVLGMGFTISFSYLLYRYPLLINFSLYSYSAAITFTSFLQNLGLFVTSQSYGLNNSRLTVLNFHPNAIGIQYAFTALVLIYYLYLSLAKENFSIRYSTIGIIKKTTLIIGLLSNFYALYITSSRGSILGLILGILVFYSLSILFYGKSRNNFIFILFITFALTLLFFYIFQQDQYVTDISSHLRIYRNQSSYTIRKDLILDVSRYIFQDNFWFGIGKKGLMDISEQISGVSMLPHNAFIEIFGYSGFFGLTIFCIFLISLIRTTIKFSFQYKDILTMLILVIILTQLLFFHLILAKLNFYLFAILLSVGARYKKFELKKIL